MKHVVSFVVLFTAQLVKYFNSVRDRGGSSSSSSNVLPPSSTTSEGAARTNDNGCDSSVSSGVHLAPPFESTTLMVVAAAAEPVPSTAGGSTNETSNVESGTGKVSAAPFRIFFFCSGYVSPCLELLVSVPFNWF